MEESDSESEEEFVLAKSHTENSSEPDVASDEMVVQSEKPTMDVNTGEGEAQDMMNKEAKSKAIEQKQQEREEQRKAHQMKMETLKR